MNSVVEIIMKRDGVDEETAREMVEECREVILHSSPFEADSIIECMLGLEPDYMFEVIGY